MSDYWWRQRVDDAMWAEQQRRANDPRCICDPPTFGRENLPREAEKAEWDRLEQWHKQLTEPEEPPAT